VEAGRRDTGRWAKRAIGDLERDLRWPRTKRSAFVESISGALNELLRGRSSTGAKKEECDVRNSAS